MMFLYAVALLFTFNGTKKPKHAPDMIQHENAPVHEKHGLPKLVWKNSSAQSPDLNATEHILGLNQTQPRSCTHECYGQVSTTCTNIVYKYLLCSLMKAF